MLDENLERGEPFGHSEHQMDAGNCPVCGGEGELMNVWEQSCENWFVCREHRLRWWFGSGWFKGLGVASDEDRRALETYQDTKPVYGLRAEQLRMQHATDVDVTLALVRL